jgi:hypothetical protein
MNFKFNTDTNLEVGIRNDKEKKVEKILIWEREKSLKLSRIFKFVRAFLKSRPPSSSSTDLKIMSSLKIMMSWRSY